MKPMVMFELPAKTLLSTIDSERTTADIPNKRTIFAQGDVSDAVFYIQQGKVKLNVVSKIGKEATIAILREGDFFGEGCLTAQPLRLYSAAAITNCRVLRIEKKAMVEVLHREREFADMFVASLLSRNIRYEADLVDQLFNTSEKRLARLLLLLAELGNKENGSQTIIPKISQGTMAEMVGTTRSRVSFFMNRFRASGLVSYDGQSRLQINASRLNSVLRD